MSSHRLRASEKASRGPTRQRQQHIGALAGANQLPGGPRTLRYAIGALDQLSRRMRAVATADSPERARRAAVRAGRRRHLPARALQLTFRSAWPPWVLLDDSGQPAFDRLGMLCLNPQARYVPPVGSEAYRMIVRDAYLLAERLLPVDVDGRKEMALRNQRHIPTAPRRPVRTEEQRELAELAYRIREPVGLLARVSPAYRQAWLARLRAEEAQRAQQDVLAFKARLQRIADQRRQAHRDLG